MYRDLFLLWLLLKNVPFIAGFEQVGYYVPLCNLLEIHRTSQICEFTVFIKFWKLLGIILSNTLSGHPSSCAVEVLPLVPCGSWVHVVEAGAIPALCEGRALVFRPLRVTFTPLSCSFLTCVCCLSQPTPLDVDSTPFLAISVSHALLVSITLTA